IAQRYLGIGYKYKEIKELNALKSDTIYVGQTLKIPR
ncbi:MAG: LysM peptidoglycan-binding domain-containing protein, partial [Clostridia bacterium]|nr:LysM peptidoglycan-binding domain-containing protein [Clostridia bacterium]MBR2734660.1 LysM peptidoglycan-binding domain-containing protein [Clostridia bacterium]